MSDLSTPGSMAGAGGPELTLVPPVVAVDAAAGVPSAKTMFQRRVEVRIWCSFVFMVCGAMFSLALYLTPQAGLHQRFGVPECGMLQMTGLPCPTCGCTTAVTYLAHGHPLASLATQPFGFAVGLVALILLPLTFWGMVTGNWKGPSMWVLGWHWRYWTYGGMGVLLAAWMYRLVLVQMHWN